MRAPAHRQTTSTSPWPRYVAYALLAIVLFVASTVLFAYLRVQGNIETADVHQYLDDRPSSQAPEPGEDETIEEENPEALNILVIGSDVRANVEGDPDAQAEANEITGMRSDTTMVVHVSEDRSRVEVVSIPRDLLVEIPSCRLPAGQHSPSYESAMFNKAFAIGGETGDVAAATACTIATVEKMSGLYIDDFVVVDFDAFKTLVDTLGGVSMCFDEPLQDDMSGLDLKAGCHKLDGTEALAFARARQGLGDGSDIGRMGRQQELVTAIIDETLSKNVLTNVPMLYQLVDRLSQSIVTGNYLGSVRNIGGLGNSLSGLDSKEIFTITLPWQIAPQDQNRLVTAPAAEEVWRALRRDVPLNEVVTPEGELIPEEAAESSDTPSESAPAESTDF